MKSTLYKKCLESDRHIIECSCLAHNHLLIIEIDNEYKTIDFSFVSNWREPFLKRVKEAFKYIFLKKWYHTSNTVMITKDNIEDLEKAIADIKKA